MSFSDDLGTTVFIDLSRVLKLLHALKGSAPRFHDAVEQAAYPVLLVLSEGPARITSLAERTHSDPSVVSRQVSHLEHHGLVSKAPDSADRRASVAALTPAGAALVDEILAGRGRWLARMLHDWSEQEVRDFDAHLVRLTGCLERELARFTASDPLQENA